MLPVLLLLIAAQVPAVPGEGTLVSFCKQGRLSACEELAKVNPRKAAEIQAELAKTAMSREALLLADEATRANGDATDESSEAATTAEASDESTPCTGQEHHIISRRIFAALEDHKTLRGLFKPRDKRFKTRAKDKESHCGYQEWHRDVDEEVINWIERQEKATPEQFLKMLREIYNRPEMRKRFPHGF